MAKISLSHDEQVTIMRALNIAAIEVSNKMENMKPTTKKITVGFYDIPRNETRNFLNKLYLLNQFFNNIK